MPPDRTSDSKAPRETSTSFAEATARKLPLSSHGAKHKPSLERGAACLVCRSRKIRCDSVQPACTPCRKSATAKGEDPDLLLCDYDAPEVRRRPVGGGKVAGLESKIAALEARIEELLAEKEGKGESTSADLFFASDAAQLLSDAPDYPPAQPQAHPLPAVNQFQSTSESQFLPDPAHAFSPQPRPPASSVPHLPERYDQINAPPPQGSGDIRLHNYFAQSHVAHRPPVPLLTPFTLPEPSPLLSLFYPGWPQTLPSPALVFRLVEVFFAKSHLVSCMINRPRLLASLQLPPTDEGFPVTPLLHAIIAISASMVSDDVWASEERQYWAATNETPSEWHGRQAKIGIESSWVNDHNHLQVAQAAVICCFLSYSSARFGEVWLECAQATRLAVPMGLNHLRSNPPSIGTDWAKQAKTSMLPATNDEDELHERAVTFWFAFTCDRFASASTGWASSLEEADITTLLPAPPGFIYPNEHLNSSPLSLHNSAFFTSHPPHLVQSLQLYIKSVVLMGRVVSWLQRSPFPIGVGLNNGPPRFVPAASFMDPRDSPDFQALDATLVAFQNSIPRSYFHLTLDLSSDIQASLVHAIPYASTILLHEPFVTLQDNDPSMHKCSVAAKEILRAIVTLYSSSFDIALLVPFLCFAWAVAGRTLVRELAIKEAKGIREGCDALRASVTTILAAMRAYATGLGNSTSQALEFLLKNPSTCLPDLDLKHHAFGFAPVYDPVGAPIYLPRERRRTLQQPIKGQGSPEMVTATRVTPNQHAGGSHGAAGASEGSLLDTLMLLGANFGEGANERFEEMDSSSWGPM